MFCKNKLMELFMKKFSLLLALALLVAGGVFAQKAGDTVKLQGQTQEYTVEQINGDTLVLKKLVTLDGVWNNGYTTITITGNSGVTKAVAPNNTNWQNALKSGIHKIGAQQFKITARTGDRTWSGQVLDCSPSGASNPTSMIWNDVTFRLSDDGRSVTTVYTNVNHSSTYRKQ
jgi:hypothetical protein